MVLLEPKFLLLALVAILFWIGPLRARTTAHGLLRTGAWLALVLALSYPVWKTGSGPVHRVLIVDESASVQAAEAPPWQDWIRDDGDEAWTVLKLRGKNATGSETPAEGSHAAMESASTPIAEALQWAIAQIPDGRAGGVILASDGHSTDGFPTRALSEMWGRGIPLSFVELPAPDGDLRPVGLAQPQNTVSSARVGSPVTLIATLEGQGQVVHCQLVDVSEGGEERDLVTVQDVLVDGTQSTALTFEPNLPGFRDIELRVTLVSGGDAVPGDLTYQTTLAVQDPIRVAYLGERMREGGSRLAELLGPGFALVEDASPATIARSHVVVLDDRPADAVSQEVQERLVQAVTQRGLGLVAAGGESAFGPGGYHNQPLETLLPVEMVQKEEKRDPSTSLVLIIDTSGSMGGNRVQLAKQVSRLAIRRLLPHDKVGIVEFYGAKRWAVPLQPASNSIEIERALNRLDAGGGTVILPAIEEAYYGLKNVRTRYKHVLILTDGGVETGAFESLLRRMSDDGINVSTVLVGPDAHSEFLVNLANWGQGRFYSVPNRFNLPEILLKQPASAKLPAYRPGVTDVSIHGGRGWWGDLEAAQVPPVSGYVETRLRPGAERLIETQGEKHPILASWRYGLGRVTALTTEPTGPGTEGWQDWPGYAGLLARVCMRTADDGAEPFAFALEADGDWLRLVAERRRAPAGLPFARTTGDGALEAKWEMVSPDRFESRLPIPPGENVALLAGAVDSEMAPLRLIWNNRARARAERHVPSAMATDIASAAEELGGAITLGWPADSSALPISNVDATEGAKRLAPWFALLALLLYLWDLLYRRLPRNQS